MNKIFKSLLAVVVALGLVGLVLFTVDLIQKGNETDTEENGKNDGNTQEVLPEEVVEIELGKVSFTNVDFENEVISHEVVSEQQLILTIENPKDLQIESVTFKSNEPVVILVGDETINLNGTKTINWLLLENTSLEVLVSFDTEKDVTLSVVEITTSEGSKEIEETFTRYFVEEIQVELLYILHGNYSFEITRNEKVVLVDINSQFTTKSGNFSFEYYYTFDNTIRTFNYELDVTELFNLEYELDDKLTLTNIDFNKLNSTDLNKVSIELNGISLVEGKDLIDISINVENVETISVVLYTDSGDFTVVLK